MSEHPLDQQIKANAYRLFFAELEKHLSKASSCLDSTEPPPAESVREIGTAFHMIRGGAGFFGLDRLSELAARAEHLFLEGLASSFDRLGEARDLVREVEALVDELPRPTPPKGA